MRVDLTPRDVQNALDRECGKFRAIMAQPTVFASDAMTHCIDNIRALRVLSADVREWSIGEKYPAAAEQIAREISADERRKMSTAAYQTLVTTRARELVEREL